MTRRKAQRPQRLDSLGTCLAFLRLLRGSGQQEAARAAALNGQAWCRVERGRVVPQVETLVQFLAVMEFDFQQLWQVLELAARLRNVAEPPNLRQIGQGVQALRERAEVKRDELAKQLGFSESFLWELEHGYCSPSLQRLVAVLAALDANLEDLQLWLRLGMKEPQP